MIAYRLTLMVLLVLAASTYAVFAATDRLSARMPAVGSIYTQEMKDSASTQLAKLLRGKSLECHSARDKTGLFPITLKAADLGRGKTALSLATKSGGAFSASRDHFKVEKSSGWFIIKDEKRFLYLSVANNKISTAMTAIQRDDGAIQDPLSVDCKLK